MKMKFLAAPVLGFLLVIGTNAAASADPPPASITVTGHGMVSRGPDIAVITAEIVSNAADARSTADKNNVIQDRVVKALQRLHLPDDAAHTMFYRSTYVPPSKNSDANERTGYLVTRTIQVEVTPAQIDATTQALTDAGVETIDDVRSDVRHRDGVYRELFNQAVKDADAQARTIAAAAHVRITRMRSIDASSFAPQGPGLMMGTARLATIPENNLTLSATLSVVYDVEPQNASVYMRKTPNPAGAKGTH